jgi:hypothetical protein
LPKYALLGQSYVFGQRVEVWPLHVQVTARSGALVTAPGVAPGTQQLYFIDITWHNPTLESFVMPYAERVRLRAITTPGGAVVSHSSWGTSALALQEADMQPPPELVPPGVSRVTIPVIAPPGEPETVEIDVATDPDYVPLLPSSTTLPGTPTPANRDLRARAPELPTVQWSNAEWVPPGAEACADPGALTDLGGGGRHGLGCRGADPGALTDLGGGGRHGLGCRGAVARPGTARCGSLSTDRAKPGRQALRLGREGAGSLRLFRAG